jgi:cytoskeletal protein RodZ
MTVFIILILVGVAGFFAYNKFFKKKEEQENPFISSDLQEKLQKKVQREAPAVITEEEFKKSQLDNLEKVKKAPVVEPEPVKEPIVEEKPVVAPVLEEPIAKPVVQEVQAQVTEAPTKKRRKYTKRKRK